MRLTLRAFLLMIDQFLLICRINMEGDGQAIVPKEKPHTQGKNQSSHSKRSMEGKSILLYSIQVQNENIRKEIWTYLIQTYDIIYAFKFHPR